MGENSKIKIEKADADNFTLTLSNYELELLHQIILNGIDKLTSDQYELLKSIRNIQDSKNLDASIAVFHEQTEQETTANILAATLEQFFQKHKKNLTKSRAETN